MPLFLTFISENGIEMRTFIIYSNVDWGLLNSVDVKWSEDLLVTDLH
jgi:hypothetical protein